MSFDEHVDGLCGEFKITRKVRPGRGHANVKKRTIQHAPLDLGDEMAYFVALHEIGHIIVGLKETRLEREAAAWVWALDAALTRPSYVTRQRICACLWRYYRRAVENNWPIPPEGHMFWELMEWW